MICRRQFTVRNLVKLYIIITIIFVVNLVVRTGEVYSGTFNVRDSVKYNLQKQNNTIGGERAVSNVRNSTANYLQDKYNAIATEGNMSTVYDEFRLYTELAKLHNSLYKPSPGDRCEIRKVKCLIVGVAKCGTQELIDFMSIHPNIVIKPYPYLANPTLFETEKEFERNKAVRGVKKSGNPQQKMPCTYSDQVGMVKADYFFIDSRIPEMLYKYDKDLKMILMVREPIARMISAMTFTFFGNLKPAVRKNLTMEDMPTMDRWLVYPQTGKVATGEQRIIQSTYDVAMLRFLKYFKMEQFLVIEVNELRKDPVAVARRVEEYLGLEHVISSKYLVYNPEKKFHCLMVNHELICYGNNRGRPKLKDLSEGTNKKLKEYFKPHNEKFFELIGKRFEW